MLLSKKALKFYFEISLKVVPENKVTVDDIYKRDKYVLSRLCKEITNIKGFKKKLYDKGFLRSRRYRTTSDK